MNILRPLPRAVAVLGTAPAQVPLSVFDGTSDYMLRGGGLTGAADGKMGIFSLWLHLASDTGNRWLFTSDASRVEVVMLTGTNVIRIRMRASNGTVLFQGATTSNVTISSGVVHFLCSWDIGTAGARHLYLNDVDDLALTTFTDGVIDYTHTEWAVGAFTDGTLKGPESMGGLYFNSAEYLDISVEANRRKFIDGGGRPVDLGPSGRRPTGSSPLIYMNNPFSSFENNLGSGGDFTVTGALADGGFV